MRIPPPRWAASALLILIAAVVALPLAADAPSDPSLLLLEEAFLLTEELGPDLWPGFSAVEAPVVLCSEDRELLLNSTSPALDFEPIEGSFRARPIFARSPTLPPNLLASFPLIGQETVVIGTPEATGLDPAVWVLTVGHELFHVHQASGGLTQRAQTLDIPQDDQGLWQLEHPFPYGDPRVQRALHLTGYELYLVHSGEDDALYRARVAQEALQLARDLLDLLEPRGYDSTYLRFATAKEGLARYFEYRLAEVAARRPPRPGFTQAYGDEAFVRAWEDRYRGYPNQVKHLGQVSRSRLELYNLGLGLGLALDRVAPGWKERLVAEQLWLDELFLDPALAAPGCPTPTD